MTGVGGENLGLCELSGSDGLRLPTTTEGFETSSIYQTRDLIPLYSSFVEASELCCCSS